MAGADVLSLRSAPPQQRNRSMKFVHQREHLNEDDIVVIECSQQCNIRLMNDANFRSFKNGGRHSYHGGAFDRVPAKIKVPSTGFWNITIDTVTRRPISVTRKPNFKWTIKFVRRSGSQFT
ncbi:DUF1883 domain-containing protein [Pseudomonas aeruginosa]|nr:DUF1883 domain-containing protein [Pseudomonas aeruginosa]